MRLASGGTAASGWVIASPPIPPALRPFVSSWAGYDEWTQVPMRRVEVPTGRAVLILEFGPPLGVADFSGVLRRHRGGFFAGVGDQASLTEVVERQAGVQVNLTPRGARAFVAGPMAEVARQVVGLEDLRLGSNLEERLADAPDWDARFDVVVATLLPRLGRARPPSDLVLSATRRIDACEGAVRIDDLSRELGYSRKHLHASFLRDVGLSPKRYADVRRFDRLRRRLATTANFANLAAELGYADHAHLARDARRFSSMTATALQRTLNDPLGSAVQALADGDLIPSRE